MNKWLLCLLSLPANVMAQILYTPQGHGKLPVNYVVNCIYPLSDDEVWALASPIMGVLPVKLCKTTDGGANWTVTDIDKSSGLADDLFVQPGGIAYANVEDSMGQFNWFKTQNGGSSWYKIANATGLFVHMFSHTEGAMLAPQVGSYSTDSFHTNSSIYSNQPGGPPKVTGQNSMGGPFSRCITDSGLFFIYPKGYIVRTQDKGKTWKGFLTGLNTSRSICGLAQSANTLLAIQWPQSVSGVTKGMSRSTDGGNNWTVISSSIPTAIQSPLVICAVPGQSGHFIMTGYSELYHSLNYGDSWADLAPPSGATNSASGAFSMSSTNIGWYGLAVLSGGEPLIYKCEFEFSRIPNQTNQQHLTLFPNPTQNELHINSTDNYSYSLFDMQGKMIAQGRIIKGANLLSTSLWQNGNYLLRFDNNQHSFQKIITVHHP